MEIFVNGETHPISDPTTVETIVKQLGYSRRGVAVAVNNDVVPRSLWDEHHLGSGDRIEILQAAQGG